MLNFVTVVIAERGFALMTSCGATFVCKRQQPMIMLTEVTRSVMEALDSEASRDDLRVCVGGEVLIPTGSYKQPNEHSTVLYLVFESDRTREVVLTMRKIMQQFCGCFLGKSDTYCTSDSESFVALESTRNICYV